MKTYNLRVGKNDPVSLKSPFFSFTKEKIHNRAKLLKETPRQNTSPVLEDT